MEYWELCSRIEDEFINYKNSLRKELFSTLKISVNPYFLSGDTLTLTAEDSYKYGGILEKGYEYILYHDDKRYKVEIRKNGNSYAIRGNVFWAKRERFLREGKITLYPLTDSFELNILKTIEDQDLRKDSAAWDLFALTIDKKTIPFKKRLERIQGRESEIKFIWGPPGSGKTREIVNTAKRLSKKGEKILILANNNLSVNDLYMKMKAAKLEIIRIGEGGIEKRTAIEKTLDAIRDGQIIFLTVAKALIEYPHLFRNNYPFFNYILLDEAGVVRSRHFYALSLISQKGFYIYGDHKQLSPVENENSNTEMIYDILGLSKEENINDGNVCRMLDTEYRMNSEISSFVSSTFYSGRLRKGKKGEEKIRKSAMDRIFSSGMNLLDISPYRSYFTRYEKSYLNFVSAYFSIMTALLYRKFIGNDITIGISTPYKAESRLLSLFAKDLFSKEEMENTVIDTVHSFQGKEVNIMIFDIPDAYPLETLSRLLTLTDEKNRNGESDRLLNVAISRARVKFILISDYSFLEEKAGKDTTLSILINYLKQEEKKRKRNLKLLVNLINENLSEYTEIGLFGKMGDKAKMTSSSQTSWKMRKEFWEKDDEITIYPSKEFSKTSLNPTLKKNVEKHKRKVIFSIAEGKFKLKNAEKAYSTTYPFPITTDKDSLIYGAFHSTKETKEEGTVPFIRLKRYKFLLTELFSNKANHTPTSSR